MGVSVARTTSLETLGALPRCNNEALHAWARQAEVDHGERDHRLTAAERNELSKSARRRPS